MEQSFADLLGDAFSESSIPSFPDGELDFENLNFDENFDEDKVVITQENSEEDGALHQEATCHTAVLETSDMSEDEDEDEELCGAGNVEENFQRAQVSLMNVEEAPQEDYTSSGEEQEESVSGEDDEVEEEDTGTGGRPGDLLMSVHCRDEFRDDNKEDRSFAEGQPLAPEGPEKPQVRNQDQGESERKEEVSYFGIIPGIKGDGIEEEEQKREEDEEERQERSSDSECEGMKIEAETFLNQVENPYRPTKASLEFSEISEQSLQDLIAEIDTEEHVDKMKDFSGEENQEAGESFADYPSDLSSCEYVDAGGKDEDRNHQSHLDCTSESGSEAKEGTVVTTWMRSDDEEGEGYLYSRDLEMDTDMLMSLDSSSVEKSNEKTEIVELVLDEEAVKECYDEDEASESDSYSSSDDEEQLRRSDDEFPGNLCFQCPEHNKQQEENQPRSWTAEAFSSWSISDDHRSDSGAFNICWDLDMSTNETPLSENTDEPETLPSCVTPLEGVSTNSYSEIQRVEAKPISSSSNQGSLDDGFFFTEPEASGTSALGHLGDDEYEEERNWEQEQERIEAFYKFYSDSDGENGREERKIKVQFCAEPLSQVIHYETDSTDRDSLSSSSDAEEDLSPAEPSEEQKHVEDIARIVQTACETPEPTTAEFTEKEPELSDNTHICTRKHKCLYMLKVILKMSLVVLMGLLMFWFITDQADWLSPASSFEG